MDKLLEDLAEVVRLIAKEDADNRLSLLCDNEELNNACYWFAKNHHAEIAEAWEDARRYRWLRDKRTKEELDVVMHDEGDELDSALDAAIAQHNSAREGE